MTKFTRRMHFVERFVLARAAEITSSELADKRNLVVNSAHVIFNEIERTCGHDLSSLERDARRYRKLRTIGVAGACSMIRGTDLDAMVDREAE